MSTLAFKFEEIAPRELRPEVYELDGISRASVEAHYKLYQGYVNKRNEILGKLAGVDPGAANQVYSELRALKVDLTFAIGGIKNHELYFAHLGGGGGAPSGSFGALAQRAQMHQPAGMPYWSTQPFTTSQSRLSKNASMYEARSV